MSASGLAAHLSPAELGQRYRAARSPVERSHLQIVWLLSRGRGRGGAGGGHGLRAGVGGGDRPPLRRGWAGRPGRPAARERRRQAVARGRGRGGAAGRAGRAAVRRRAVDRPQGRGLDGRPARAQGVAAARLGLPQEARPQPTGAEAAARQGGGRGGAGGVQKKLAAQVDEYREAEPGRSVEVWAFDEHRLGLKPVLRRQWAPKGQRPIAVGRHRYEWLYLYGFVHPGTGEVVWFICSTVDAELLSAVLAAFAEAPGRTSWWSWSSTTPAGTSAATSCCRRGASSRSCRPTRPSCSRPSTCGRWRTRRSRTSTSPPSRISTRRWASAAGPWPTCPRSSRPPPTSPG